MSHQSYGPRNYVHKAYHEERVKGLKDRVTEAERVRDKVDEECVMLRQFHEDHQDDETGAARVNELTRERNAERDRVSALEAERRECLSEMRSCDLNVKSPLEGFLASTNALQFEISVSNEHRDRVAELEGAISLAWPSHIENYARYPDRVGHMDALFAMVPEPI